MGAKWLQFSFLLRFDWNDFFVKSTRIDERLLPHLLNGLANGSAQNRSQLERMENPPAPNLDSCGIIPQLVGSIRRTFRKIF